MMGFAGQLSLGHALYVGLGAYTSAALFVHFGMLPWLGMLAGVAVAALAGAVIAALSFRFGVTGVYFALLTIAFDEFTRILFDHFDWVGGSAGLFLPVTTLDAQRSRCICAARRRCSITCCWRCRRRRCALSRVLLAPPHRLSTGSRSARTRRRRRRSASTCSATSSRP